MKKWRLSRKKQNAAQPTLPGLVSPPKKHRLSTPHEQALRLAQGRLSVIILIFAVAWITISGRLAYLTLSGEPDSQSAHAIINEGPTQRADITDRNGTVVATSLPTVSLCANSKDITNPDEAAKQLLSALPDLNPKKLSDDLQSGKHCVSIRRHLTPRQYYEVNKLGIAGLEFHPDERRIYPTGNLLSHVVGYSDIDDNGIAGVEKSMDDRLNDNPNPLPLSIDLRVQSILHEELAEAMGDYHAEAATGLVMDITTGEVLGMVSLPDFDPGHPGNAAPEQLFNRATLGVYEMGSTFKIFNTALALDSGLVHINDVFDTTHILEIGGHKIHDFESESHNLNVAEIFTHSSNIGSAHMAQRFGGTRQRAFFTRLGLTEKTPFEIPEVGAPLIPPARDWSEATTLTAAFGQGVAVNSLQLATAVATIANDGHPVHPTLLKRDSPPAVDEDVVVSPHTAALVRGLMRLVVTRGTAKKADVEGYEVGGKTGTAQISGTHGHYIEGERRASFIGLFPINAPRYLVFGLLDDPKGNAKTGGFATAGWVIAPAINHIIAQIGPLLGMAPLSKDMRVATEHQILKPLGAETVDGLPVEEGSNYASFESDSVQ